MHTQDKINKEGLKKKKIFNFQVFGELLLCSVRECDTHVLKL